MSHQTDRYEIFLSQLRRLTFGTVKKVLKKRDDLIAFKAKDGGLVTRNVSWFGAVYSELSGEDLERAEPEYSYYCGFTEEDVFFSRHTRSIKRDSFLPASSRMVDRRSPPNIGEVIFGHIDENESKKKFFWWNLAMREDRNFANLLSGRTTFSDGNLEKKLVIKSGSSPPDWTLFFLAKAIHFRDVEYFAELVRRFGDRPAELNLECTVEEWLRHNVADLLPEFWKEFRRRICAGAVDRPETMASHH